MSNANSRSQITRRVLTWDQHRQCEANLPTLGTENMFSGNAGCMTFVQHESNAAILLRTLSPFVRDSLIDYEYYLLRHSFQLETSNLFQPVFYMANRKARVVHSRGMIASLGLSSQYTINKRDFNWKIHNIEHEMELPIKWVFCSHRLVLVRENAENRTLSSTTVVANANAYVYSVWRDGTYFFIIFNYEI